MITLLAESTSGNITMAVIFIAFLAFVGFLLWLFKDKF